MNLDLKQVAIFMRANRSKMNLIIFKFAKSETVVSPKLTT